MRLGPCAPGNLESLQGVDRCRTWGSAAHHGLSHRWKAKKTNETKDKLGKKWKIMENHEKYEWKKQENMENMEKNKNYLG